jgi:hypothetical protein
METIDTQKNKVNWKAVILFYLIACAVSWPFFWWRDMNPGSWQSLPVPGFLKNWSYMWGPGVSAIICLLVFKRSHHRTITFFGSSIAKSLLFYFLPLLALCIPGIHMEGIEPHLAPLLLSIFGFISILGEELGWRGFLQDALRPLPELKKYILIGVMWELWHFTNRMGHGELPQIIVRVAMFTCVTVLLSFLIGRAADRSRSLMIAVTLHAWVDLLFEFGNTWTYLIFALSVPFWIWLLWSWNRKTELQAVSTPDGGI